VPVRLSPSIMLRTIFRRSIGVIGLCLCLTAQASTLTWDRTEVRMELQPHETEAQAVYTVTNNGTDPLRMDRLETSCGCTLAKIDRKILRTGESARITAIFNKGKRQGKNHTTVKVYMEGKSEPVAVLHMVVRIPLLVEATPRILYWKSGSLQTEQQIHLALDRRYMDRLTAVDYDRQRLTVIQESDPDGKVDFILRVTPKRFDASLRDTIVIHASGPDGLRADARIHVFVQP